MNAAYAPGLSSVPGVPASASASAGHSLGEAYDVAGRLGGARGAALRDAARHAFVHGLHVTLLVSAALLLLGAVMALRLPRIMHCEASLAAVPAPGNQPNPESPPDRRVLQVRTLDADADERTRTRQRRRTPTANAHLSAPRTGGRVGKAVRGHAGRGTPVAVTSTRPHN